MALCAVYAKQSVTRLEAVGFMSLSTILKNERVLARVPARCKREALAAISERCSFATGLDSGEILDALMAREQLGSTGVGRGVAIPHGKIEGLDEVVGVMATLEEPIDFDASDGEQVDILFGLFAPIDATAAHLKALARVSRFLRDENNCATLRGAESVEAIYAIATRTEKSDAA